MKKIFISFILSLFLIFATSHRAEAITINLRDFLTGNQGPMQELNDNIVTMAGRIYEGSSQMMKYADMLKCYAEYGKGAYYSIGFWFISITIHWLEPWTYIAAWILLIVGFFIMMIASFYMFDVSFNIAISLFILPIGLALWPFGWTKDKLKPIIESIVYYSGLFIFLPLGITIATTLVRTVINQALESQEGTNGRSFEEIFLDGQSDILQESFNLWSTGFYIVLLTYIVALRIIPLMAGEFCKHFFGAPLVGTPMADKIKDGIQALNKQTLGRAGKYAKDVAKHQTGQAIKNHTNSRSGSFVSRMMHRYGSQMAKTRR